MSEQERPADAMAQKALNVLHRTIDLQEENTDSKRVNRLLDLLRSQDSKGEKDCFFCVPACFNEALDIRLTQRKKKGEEAAWVWTQGGRIDFKLGDVLYDSPGAYESWQVSGMRFRYCLQVNSGIGATPATAKTKRNPGCVNFSVFVPDKQSTTLNRKGEYSLTQDEFLRFLITGSSTTLALNEKEAADLWTR